MIPIVRTLAAAGIALAAGFATGISPRIAADPPAVVFKDVRVFDGTAILPKCAVVVVGSTIAAVGPDVAVPPGAEIIPGEGLTLLPGLIDSHVHVFSPRELRQSLVFGVTTVLDMSTLPQVFKPIKERQAAGATPDMADLFSAGHSATVPGGHGTEYGGIVPTLTTPAEAADFVARRKAEGSDYLKIMSGAAKHVLTPETIVALASEARRQGLLSLVHVNVRAFAAQAVEAGVSGLAHCFADVPPEDGLIGTMKAKGTFVIPTLSVMNDLPGVPPSDLTTDPRLAPDLAPDLVEALAIPARQGSSAAWSFGAAEETARRLHAAGVPLLAGTDSINPGTAHGASMHRELALLVRAGLTPADALAAATSVPAGVFGLRDRGRIAPGLRADLLLVRGDPARDVTATRDIVGVWKLGRRLDRDAWRTRLDRLRSSRPGGGAPCPPDGSETGIISDFDSGDLFTRFGFTWFETTDRMTGGSSSVALAPGRDGADGSPGSMSLAGTLAAGTPYGWAGASFYPSSASWAPADLSSWSGISFWARGTTKQGVVMIVRSGAGAPSLQTFPLETSWGKREIPFAAFDKCDGTGIMAVVIGAAGDPGPFEMALDQVRLTRAAAPPRAASFTAKGASGK